MRAVFGHRPPLVVDDVPDVGVDIGADARTHLGRVDGGADVHLVQGLGLLAYVLLGGAAALPDARDGEAQHDRVDHADHHRHVLDDVRGLGRVVIVSDPAVVEYGDGQDDGARRDHGEGENKPFRHGFLRRSSGAGTQHGDGEHRGGRDQQGEGDQGGAAPRDLARRLAVGGERHGPGRGVRGAY